MCIRDSIKGEIQPNQFNKVTKAVEHAKHILDESIKKDHGTAWIESKIPEILKILDCELKKNSNQIVFNDGDPGSPIMIIGEGPGQKEDEMGKPFVGAAGQLLNKMLAAINLDRNSVYITNIVPWRPPKNRAPNNEEILQCLPFIQKHIEIIKPSILILLGGTATKAILTTTHGITKLRGQWHEYNNLYINKRHYFTF